jgi:hypothetical protein
MTMKGLSLAAFVVLSTVISVHCYRYSMYDIDVLAYAGNVALFDTTDLSIVHKIVYSGSLTPHLRGTDAEDQQARVLRRRAADSYYSAAYLPYFSVKPLYVLALEVAHLLGASVIDSSRVVSAFFYFCISVIAWLYTRSLLSAAVLIIPEVMILGQANEPDAMSVFLLILGLWLLFIKACDLGILPMIVSVWVRPDNLIACAVTLGFLYLSRKISARMALSLLAIAGASAVLITHYGYGWRSLYFHTFLGGDPMSSPHFGGADYVRAVSTGLKALVHSSVPTFSLLWLLCFSFLKNGARQILGVSLLFSALRFVIYPSYETRYYGLLFLTIALSAVWLIRAAPFYQRITNHSDSMLKKCFPRLLG